LSNDGAIEVGLNAAVVSVTADLPRILTVPGENSKIRDGLPFGAFDPARHRTMEASLRDSVEAQTALKLGYIEQLYTFGDRGRHKLPDEHGPHNISVGYLALTRADAQGDDRMAQSGARWRDWYSYLPWEDWREGRPALIDNIILPALKTWAAKPDKNVQAGRMPSRLTRLRLAFGLDDFPFDDERVLDRYELLYEAGLISEAVEDGRAPDNLPKVPLGIAMRYDHRRIAATAIARLRGKIKYRPVIFELMADDFTLTELQTTVEAISGRHLHKQNFRRLVEGAELVEPTGMSISKTAGRPAALFRFRRQILDERPAPGLKVGGR
jgi:hypothetical protein